MNVLAEKLGRVVAHASIDDVGNVVDICEAAQEDIVTGDGAVYENGAGKFAKV